MIETLLSDHESFQWKDEILSKLHPDTSETKNVIGRIKRN